MLPTFPTFSNKKNSKISKIIIIISRREYCNSDKKAIIVKEIQIYIYIIYFECGWSNDYVSFLSISIDRFLQLRLDHIT